MLDNVLLTFDLFERTGVVVSKALQLLQKSSKRGESDSFSVEVGQGNSSVLIDDLSRTVYGILGIPIDAIDFPTLMQAMKVAAEEAAPFMISTPNVNFLVKSQANSAFRESMLSSNLCLADGMPLIWIAKLLRLPHVERVAGADLFGRLKATNILDRKLRVFLLGGGDGVADVVAQRLRHDSLGMECVGVLNPGFGSIDEMSSPDIINAINASSADLLTVFFGAQKAQAWLLHNRDRLTVPIRAQFGATINFEAGIVKRAPLFMRSTGFEWLWRIKEEPYLWRRYLSDGKALLAMLVSCVLPLMISDRRNKGSSELSIDSTESRDLVRIALSGSAVAAHVDHAIDALRDALNSEKPVLVDLSRTQHIDARFFGLFLMARKRLSNRGQTLAFTGVPPRLRRIFRLNKFDFLLSPESR